MAIPLIAAGLAAGARVVTSKLVTRAVGGITGAGAKSVGSVYRNQGFNEAVLKQPSYTPRNSLGSNSVKVVPNKNTQTSSNSMGDKRPQASLPVNSPARGKNAVKVNSNPMRGK